MIHGIQHSFGKTRVCFYSKKWNKTWKD